MKSLEEQYGIFPLNSNDNERYTWDHYNDTYARAVLLPHILDWAEVKAIPVLNVTTQEMMDRYGLVLNSKDERNELELYTRGNGTIWYDTKDKPIGFMHECGVVVSQKEWQDVDWQQVDADYQEAY